VFSKENLCEPKTTNTVSVISFLETESNLNDYTSSFTAWQVGLFPYFLDATSVLLPTILEEQTDFPCWENHCEMLYVTLIPSELEEHFVKIYIFSYKARISPTS
jgi:hypothetical protein